MGSQHQMKMVGHQAIAQQIDRHTGAARRPWPRRRRRNRRLVKNGLAAVAPIQGVIPHPADRGSSGSRHPLLLPDGQPLSIKRDVPVFLLNKITINKHMSPFLSIFPLSIKHYAPV